MAALEQTIAAFAHGIKNIITALEGGLYVIQSALLKKDEKLLRQGSQMIEKNTEKISKLAQDLLNYSLVRPPDWEWVNLAELAAEVCSLFQQEAAQGGIQIICQCDSHLDLAYLDPKGIYTCLTNLMANALEACLNYPVPKILKIILSISRAIDGAIILEVIDNGPGISPENQKKLFTSIFTTKGTRGTGLGLLITQRIVQEHGGTITVETSPGQGSLFRIILPQKIEK